METKKCRRCKEEKPKTDFTNHSGSRDGLSFNCRNCARDVQIKHKYGLDRDSYNRLVDSQGGRCAICGIVPELLLVVDHDHSCCPGKKTCGECVRGLLCNRCNTGIGYLQDSAAILTSAARYIEDWVTQ
jgi:hypothetical protein